ncbi:MULTISPECIES: hypothetical protein [Edwardsiella]|uniref:Uncharacterized protein n=2 Tax=Edwardsiella anguillarum TaxID=1821960 RepID=A0A076LRI0_9GAMM|nr:MULTISPECIES: hypothetical protein [Edwardsiella]AIJ10566.1 Hypothetical protein ETEE_4161 [Edwardsiella anguillarum ET080813]AKR78031.1 diguanylate phosphodiesterase [Edwardsiella sp. LADL05-105]KAB0587643.1 diguanylate phosphodiesterase [Edwardsiella anguillarum]MDA6077457.1 diguanylate phosphodiesterase [Edwardsiella anguillarum]UCQ23105.1 diguanylate phosphodiesterase [Edwardsiella piscicida]
MKIRDHMEAVMSVIEEINGDNTDMNLKLLSIIIAEYMINAEVTGFEVTAWKMKVSVEISSED